jgi:cation:H+ antiporter
VTEVLAVVAGLVVLIVGGELVVRDASGLARSLGISPIVIGLTVVAFGTSSPELMVSLGATLGGSPDIAVGNVVGSNIYNILLVLGVATLIRPLFVQQQLVRFDVPNVIAITVLLWFLVLDGSLAPIEGILLVALLGVYGFVSIRSGRRESVSVVSEYEAAVDASAPVRSRPRDVLLLLIGLGALVVGAEALVGGATSLARSFGVPELVVGLTVVAIGTSMPELVTSVMAALRGQRDLAVGNAIGSNLFNILGVLGVTAIVAPGGIPVASSAIAFDIPVMIAVAVACLPLLFTGNVLRRWEGALFVTYAAIYTAYLVLGATDRALRDDLAAAMLWFVLPLTAITLVTVVAAEVRSRRRRSVTASGRTGPPPTPR